MRNYLSALADLALVVACVALSVVIIFPKALNRTNASEYQVGTTLSPVRGVSFSEAPFSLVLFFRTECRYCKESMPFYRSVSETLCVRQGYVRFIAVTPEETGVARQHLQSEGVQTYAVIGSVTDPHVRGVPCLILVDRAGRVVKIWSGFLAEQARDAVMQQLGAISGRSS